MLVDDLKDRYIRRAAAEYEYSWAPEYEKRAMTKRVLEFGTLDIDPGDIAQVDVGSDGAWVPARVWVPKAWLRIFKKPVRNRQKQR